MKKKDIAIYGLGLVAPFTVLLLVGPRAPCFGIRNGEPTGEVGLSGRIVECRVSFPGQLLSSDYRVLSKFFSVWLLYNNRTWKLKNKRGRIPRGTI